MSNICRDTAMPCPIPGAGKPGNKIGSKTINKKQSRTGLRQTTNKNHNKKSTNDRSTGEAGTPSPFVR